MLQSGCHTLFPQLQNAHILHSMRHGLFFKIGYVCKILFLFCVTLWVYTTWCVMFYSPALLFVLVSLHQIIPFSIVITSIGEEGAGLYASLEFVCLFCTCLFLCLFSSSWCRGWLRFVIVTLPGLFYYLFCRSLSTVKNIFNPAPPR